MLKLSLEQEKISDIIKNCICENEKDLEQLVDNCSTIGTMQFLLLKHFSLEIAPIFLVGYCSVGSLYLGFIYLMADKINKNVVPLDYEKELLAYLMEQQISKEKQYFENSIIINNNTNEIHKI